MKILIAEDDPVSRRLLEANLNKWGYDVLACGNGLEALQALEKPDAPALAIIDWMMPIIDGVEVCRRIRQAATPEPPYILLLTAKGHPTDIVTGLQSGADEYVTKPFEPEELRARLQVGVRILNLQKSLSDRVKELEEALSRVKRLQKLLPICSYCKKIRDAQNYWHQVESYMSLHSETQFSHSICPTCYEKFVAPELDSNKDEE